MATKQEKIEELLSRSIDTVYPSTEALRQALESGKKLRVYVGIDATGTYVHLGHATNYLLLERFHQLGHKIIVLVGDFTAMIGDPSDKTAARVRLTRDQVLANVKTFKQQIGKILDFQDKKNPIEFTFNSTWLATLSLEQLADLASHFTVQQMLERDMFEKRIAQNKPLYVHEFFYPLMQGYDSVALEVDVEVGGTDQTFNMLAGRTLVKRYQNREKFVVTTTLLANPVSGEKLMSKSAGTGIGLDESPENMFGKTMALPDEGIVQVFIDCTRLPLQEIRNIEQRLRQGENPKDIKLELAHEIVKMYHGKAAADQARSSFISQFSDKQLPINIPERAVAPGSHALSDVLAMLGLAASKSEARRLVTQKGVKLNEVVVDTDQTLVFDGKQKYLVQVGKRKFLYVK
jgi:tyrosyl-tRNA synthetase